jgi:nucleoid DNA-binding protein
MTISELITEVSARTDLPKSQVKMALGEAFSVIKQVVLDGEKVVVRSFGAFTPYDPPKRELFGGTRRSGSRRRIHFKQRSRR